MRVVQLLGSSAGGVSQHVAQISSLLAKDPQFFVTIASPSNLRDKFSGIAPHESVEISDRPGSSDVKTIGRIKEIAQGVDVIHAHGLRAGAMVGIALRSIKKADRPKLVVTLHNMPVGSWKIQAVSGVLERIVAFSADAVLGVSMDIVERMRSMKASVQGRALVPAPELAEPVQSVEDVRAALLGSSAEGSEASSRHLIVTIARLAPQKGLNTLVEASARLMELGHDHVWVVAGDGPLEGELNQLIASKGAPVKLLGRRSDISELLHAADVFVNAAVWEGQPVAVQEALRAGTALVVTDVGGTREVAGEAALYVQDSNPQAMAIAVGEILGNPTLRTGLAKRSVSRSAQLPTPEDVLESLRQVYVSA